MRALFRGYFVMIAQLLGKGISVNCNTPRTESGVPIVSQYSREARMRPGKRVPHQLTKTGSRPKQISPHGCPQLNQVPPKPITPASAAGPGPCA